MYRFEGTPEELSKSGQRNHHSGSDCGRIRLSVAYDNCVSPASPPFTHLCSRTICWARQHLVNWSGTFLPDSTKGPGGGTIHPFGFHNRRQQQGKREGRKEYTKRGKEADGAENLLFVRTFARLLYIIIAFYHPLYLFHDILHAYHLEGCGLLAFAWKGPWRAHATLQADLVTLGASRAICHISVSMNLTMNFSDECQ